MIKKFDTLYARDSKGKILQWNIEVKSSTQVDIMASYGEYNGAQVITWQRDIQGKNIGKSNETNAYEQAILEAESKIRLQKKRGYMTLIEAKMLPVMENGSRPKNFNISDIDILGNLELFLPKNRTDADGDVKPMKAQQYYRSKKDWIDPTGELWDDRKYYYLRNPNVKKEAGSIITKFPCMAQPKINGVRATIKLVDGKAIIKSKEGKQYKVSHIERYLENNPEIFNLDYNEFILDGELYIHGELLQDIGSAINKANLNTPRIIFILFDLAIEDVTNLDRWTIIKETIKPILDKTLSSPIQPITTYKVGNDEQAQIVTDKFIAQGYEGSIFRQFSGEYAFGKRPQDMTKLKRTISSEFKIIDVVSQDKDSTKGNFVCITREGLRFEVNPKGDDAFKKEVLRNRSSYIGKNLTCSFYEWTKDMKPFHILDNTVRDYE